MSRLTYNSGGTDITAGTVYLLKDSVAVRQERGVSEVDVMSQNAVTKELQKHDTELYNLVQEKANKSELEEQYLSKEEAKEMYAPADDYALKSDIPEAPDLSDFAKISDIPVNVSELINDAEYITPTYLSKYYTIDEVNGKLTELKGDTEAWLYNFYDKEEINDLLKKSKEEIDNFGSELETRVSALEAIDHDEFAKKDEVSDELEDYVKKETLNDYDTKEEVDSKIAEAIAGENIGSLLTKAEAEETYQPKGEYITEHQSLENYDTKDEINTKISERITEVSQEFDQKINDLNVSQYATVEYVDETFQPKGDYITEHQSLDHLQTIEKAEKEHAEMQEFEGELESRMEIVERLSANFQTFANWQTGYYDSTDTGLTELKQHPSCYYIIADVSNIRRDEFFAHYAPTDMNYNIWEYSGEPGATTFIKSTPKTSWDLVFELDRNTKYVVAFALLPEINNEYYLRGIKAGDETDYVKRDEFEELENRVSVLEEKEIEIPEIDLTDYAKLTDVENISEKLEKIDSDLKQLSPVKLYDWTTGKYVLYPSNGTTGSVFSYSTAGYMIVDVTNCSRNFKAFVNPSVTPTGLFAEYTEKPDFKTVKSTNVISGDMSTSTKMYELTLRDDTNFVVVNTNNSNSDSYVEIERAEYKCDINSNRLDVVENELKEYATKEYVADEIAKIEIPDVESYDDTEIKSDISEIQTQLSGIDSILNEILGTE